MLPSPCVWFVLLAPCIQELILLTCEGHLSIFGAPVTLHVLSAMFATMLRLLQDLVNQAEDLENSNCGDDVHILDSEDINKIESPST